MKNAEAFRKFIQDEKIKNVLIGNGFGLSHPKLKDAFKWNMKEALHKYWKEILPDKSLECPESDLGKIRRNIVRKILEFYVANLFKAMGKEPNANLSELYGYYNKLDYNCYEFLKTFNKVFTLNYDPIMYFEILKYKKIFFDGFVTKRDGKKDGCLQNFYEGKDPSTDFLKQEYIKCKLDKSNAKKVYFMHGSWFIQHDKDENLRKLSFGSQETHSINNLYDEEYKKPFLILEDRYNVKKDACTSDSEVYFKHCYSTLKKTHGKLLVFGVSFNNDDHILDALSKSKFSKIYITHIGCDVPTELNYKVSRKPKKEKFEFIPIQENVIWT